MCIYFMYVLNGVTCLENRISVIGFCQIYVVYIVLLNVLPVWYIYICISFQPCPEDNIGIDALINQRASETCTNMKENNHYETLGLNSSNYLSTGVRFSSECKLITLNFKICILRVDITLVEDPIVGVFWRQNCFLPLCAVWVLFFTNGIYVYSLCDDSTVTSLVLGCQYGKFLTYHTSLFSCSSK